MFSTSELATDSFTIAGDRRISGLGKEKLYPFNSASCDRASMTRSRRSGSLKLTFGGRFGSWKGRFGLNDMLTPSTKIKWEMVGGCTFDNMELA